jgi:HAD superfamily hydrolase (TIGR01549 family)
MNKFEGLIFDLDGTIVNSHSHTTNYLRYVLKKFGNLELSEDEISQLFGPSERKIFERFIDSCKIDECYKEYFNLFKKNITKITLFNGFPHILKFLNSMRRKLAIFTGRGRELTLYILKQKNLLRYFEIIVTSDDVDRHKPQPDGVLKACYFLNIPPSKVLHIGDSPLDIASGKKAGAFTGAALWGSRNQKALKEAGPDYLFRHPEEIKRFFYE